jgi:hypothetical protein
MTYVSKCGINLLQRAEVTRIWLLATQDCVTTIHPPQSGVCSQIGPLTLEATYGCVRNDTVLEVSYVLLHVFLSFIVISFGSCPSFHDGYRFMGRCDLRSQLLSFLLRITGRCAVIAREGCLKDGLGLS